MNDRVSADMLRQLLAQSLAAWRVAGDVRASEDVVVRTADREICIRRAEPGLPFRWMVSVNGRERPALSLVTVLRQVRGALDPGYAMNRVRIAVAPP